MERIREIEKSIIKKYRKEIWAKFVKAVTELELIKEHDKIAVCISGGKDSMLLAKCFQELQRHGKIPFEVVFLVMNPGYQKENLEQIQKNLEILQIPAQIFESDIFAVTEKCGGNSPCYLCARMRRGYLYAKAKELGCNKIALGHHFNDVVETILMNLIFTGQFSSMMPKLHSDHFEGMELIRPLYYVKEKDIKSWAEYNHLSFLDCACFVTKKNTGKRKEVKQLVEDLKNLYEDADLSIFRSSNNVNMNTILGYKENGVHTSFLDSYDENMEKYEKESKQ